MGKIPIRRSSPYLVLWTAIFICLTPYIILSFFGCLAPDDYGVANLCRKTGFIESQKIIFFGWGGRYTATFFLTSLAASGLLSRCIFLHPLLLLSATWLSLYFLLNCVNRCFLSASLSRRLRILMASILLSQLIYAQASTKDAIYWFSSSLSYQTATILFLLLCGCLILRWKAGSAGRWRIDLAIFLLIILISGTNELSATQLASLWIVLSALAFYVRRKVPGFLMICLLLTLAAAVAISLTSGILTTRAVMMSSNTGLFTVLSIILFRSAAVFYYIARNPLFWVCGYFLFWAGVKATPLLRSGALAALPGKRGKLPFVLTIPAMVLLPLTPILLVTHGSLPQRALDVLTQVTSLGLLACCFLAGVLRTCDATGSIFPAKPAIFPFLFAGALLANSKFVEAWENCLSGYFYHAVLKNREQRLLEAASSHQDTVRLAPFDAALENEINKAFPHGVFVELRKVIGQKPSLLPYDNETGDPYPAYEEYHGVAKIIIQN